MQVMSYQSPVASLRQRRFAKSFYLQRRKGDSLLQKAVFSLKSTGDSRMQDMSYQSPVSSLRQRRFAKSFYLQRRKAGSLLQKAVFSLKSTGDSRMQDMSYQSPVSSLRHNQRNMRKKRQRRHDDLCLSDPIPSPHQHVRRLTPLIARSNREGRKRRKGLPAALPALQPSLFLLYEMFVAKG